MHWNIIQWKVETEMSRLMVRSNLFKKIRGSKINSPCWEELHVVKTKPPIINYLCLGIDLQCRHAGYHQFLSFLIKKKRIYRVYIMQLEFKGLILKLI
jgi:hypothetical protein